MKLKLDENGHVVVKDGFPVWVAEDGAEIAYNVPDLEEALADSKKDSADRLAAKEASIRTLLVKGIFDSSAFLKDKTVLPSDVAYASFGRHFEVKEENGELRVVATMNGQPIFSRSARRGA